MSRKLIMVLVHTEYFFKEGMQSALHFSVGALDSRSLFAHLPSVRGLLPPDLKFCFFSVRQGLG